MAITPTRVVLEFDDDRIPRNETVCYDGLVEHRRTCPECENPFRTYRACKLYCSRSCATISAKRAHRERQRSPASKPTAPATFAVIDRPESVAALLREVAREDGIDPEILGIFREEMRRCAGAPRHRSSTGRKRTAPQPRAGHSRPNYADFET